MNDLLELAVPPHTGPGDWEAVLRDARVARRRRFALRGALVATAAAAVAVAFAGSPPSTIDRALAATGSGQVLHLVFESDPPRAEVNLASGERRVMRGRHEVWFDPNGETFERETFAGVVQWTAPNSSAHGREIYSSLLNGYRDALRSGTAKVVTEDATKTWINIAPGHDIAVSRRTYRPVAQRVGGHETAILTYETIDAAPPVAADVRMGMPAEPGGPPAQLARGDVWAGERGLVSVFKIDGGIGLDYGDALIFQGTGDAVTMLVGLRGVTPKPGTIVMAGNNGLTRVGDRLVSIHSTDEARTIEIAKSLSRRR